MKRRDFLTMIGAGAIAPAFLENSIRAYAQTTTGAASLTFGQSTSIITLDPAYGAFTGYPSGYEAALCLYDRLLDFDAQMRIVPQLAESYEMAGDLMSCKLVLRKSVTFHDGTVCDATAVKANIERMMDKVRNPTNRPLWDPIAGVEAPDTRTVIIRLKAPFSQLPNTLAHGSGAIVSPAAIEKHGDKGIAQNPVGAGPFKLKTFSPSQELTLEAFDGYWGGAPKTKTLVFKFIAEPATRISALRTGSVDVIDAVPVALVEQLRRDANLQVVTSPGLRPIGFAINLDREPLKNLKVRQALNLAVPVETIAQKVFFGLAKAPDSPLAFNTTGYRSVSKLVYDQARAKALLGEAGFTASNPLKLSLIVSDGLFPGDVSVAEIVASALNQVGVDATITKIERGSYWDALRQDRANVKWDIAMFGFNPSNASGLYHLASLFKSNADDAGRPDVWNIGRYRNPEVDRLLDQADKTPDPKSQAEALGRAQELIWADTPYIWLQINENVSAARKSVTGLEVWPIVFTNVRRTTA